MEDAGLRLMQNDEREAVTSLCSIHEHGRFIL